MVHDNYFICADCFYAIYGDGEFPNERAARQWAALVGQGLHEGGYEKWPFKYTRCELCGVYEGGIFYLIDIVKPRGAQ